MLTVSCVVSFHQGSTQVIKYPVDRRDVDTLTMWVNTLSSK